MLRRQDGQMMPLLMVILISVLGIGFAVFQIGRGAVLRSQAQTAADAAALAAVKNIRDQLYQQATTGNGVTDVSLIDQGAVQAAARDYAGRNDAELSQPVVVNGVDVKVWVRTSRTLGKDAEGARDERGTARARARLDLVSSYAGLPSGQGGSGGSGGSGDPEISDEEWASFAKTVNKPPRCGDGGDNDVVKLGRLLEEHGGLIGENNAFANTVDPVHTTGSFHYRCGYSGAIDLNYAGNEAAILDGLVAPLKKLGYRLIWRAPGHYDHMHIDTGTGDLTGGSGPYGDTAFDPVLIDWEAAMTPYGGIGGPGSGDQGFFMGPPDPQVARTICTVLERYDAPPKVRLAAFETAIVESGVKNLTVIYDHDSLGVYQQRASWGTVAQRTDPDWAATQFITRAIAANQPWMSAGQLSQEVQNSAYPLRYDERAVQAAALLEKYCGGV